MPLRMLRALGRNVSDLIETKVVVSAFTKEVSKTLGILPIDITIGGKTALVAFSMIDYIPNYNIFSREGLDSCQLVCVVLYSPVLTILER